MCFIKFINKTAKKLDGVDIGLVKFSAMAIALLIAKLYPPILSLDWYWYLVIAVVVAARPFHRAYLK